MSEPFTGFPEAALDFYDDLEMDNTRSFWEAHKHVYAEHVRTPMTALVEALAAEFGNAKVFRPYRDVRFARDKTPYKTHQGAFVALAPSTGWYVEISARGVRSAGGFYRAEPADLARIRTAIDNDTGGAQLEQILQKAEKAGYDRGGDRLKTSPRGWSADHPRIDLLRHRSLTLSRHYGFERVIHSADLVEEVRRDWRAFRPLVEWAADRVDVLPDR